MNITKTLLSLAAGIGFGLATMLSPTQALAAKVTIDSAVTCPNYTGVSISPTGDVTVTCSSASSPGTIVFNPTTYSANISTTADLITVTRTGGTAGNISATYATTGGCAGTGTVSFADGSTTPAISSAAPASTGGMQIAITTTPGATLPASPCRVTLTLASGSTGAVGTTPATVNVIDPNAPGTFSLAAVLGASPTAGGTAAPAVTITRSGGSKGAYDVGYTATPAGLTGASVAETSPIHFLDGDAAAKTLTLTPGSTAGTMTFALVDAAPVPAGGTTTTVNAAPVDITVSPPSNIPANCVITKVNWVAGNSIGVPLQDLKGGYTTYAFEIKATNLLNFGTYGAFRIGPATGSRVLTFNIANSPCLYSATPTLAGGIAVQGKWSASTSLKVCPTNNNKLYCKQVPAPGKGTPTPRGFGDATDVYWINFRDTGSTTVNDIGPIFQAPGTLTCAAGASCPFYLYWAAP